MRDAQHGVDLTDGPWPAAVIQALPVGLLEVDARGRAVRVNAELARLLAVAAGLDATVEGAVQPPSASSTGDDSLPVTERWPPLAEATAAVLSGRSVDDLLTTDRAVLRIRGVPRWVGPRPQGGLIVVSDAAPDRQTVVDLREGGAPGLTSAPTPSADPWTPADPSMSSPPPAAERSGPGWWQAASRSGRRRRAAARDDEHAATHDELTGLANQVLLMQRLADALASCRAGRRVGVLAVEIVAVGAVALEEPQPAGAGAGDPELLRLVASRLSQLAGPRDVVARVGGGRFVVVLRDVRAGAHAEGFLTRTTERLCGLVPGSRLPGQPAVGAVPVSGLGMVLADPASGRPHDTDAGQVTALAWEAVERSRGLGHPVVGAEAPAEAERARLAALVAYDVHDGVLDDGLQGIAQVAASTCDASAALVTFVDRDLQWVRAASGVDVEGLRESHGPRHLALCDRTLRGREVLVVPDTDRDAGYVASRHVGWQQGMRFYAGAPLITPEGRAVGTLCVLDTRPRELSERQRRSLTVLAAEIVAMLEAHRLR